MYCRKCRYAAQGCHSGPCPGVFRLHCLHGDDSVMCMSYTYPFPLDQTQAKETAAGYRLLYAYIDTYCMHVTCIHIFRHMCVCVCVCALYEGVIACAYVMIDRLPQEPQIKYFCLSVCSSLYTVC